MNFLRDSFVANFEGLVKRTDFLKDIHEMLNILQKRYRQPIDIEFAHDGKDFYLLQCRSQSYGSETEPADIPVDIENKQVLFSANKHITNGKVTGITHIVYVDPVKYSELNNHEDLLSVGKAIGRLNELLPKRQFILMGPGRWGSRGDIKLGVSITYSEINKTALLIEIAKKKRTMFRIYPLALTSFRIWLKPILSIYLFILMMMVLYLMKIIIKIPKYISGINS